MIPAALLALEASEAICPVGLGQTALTERFFNCRDETIVADLFCLRGVADRAIHLEARAAGGSGRLAGYPIGFCKPIRDDALRRLRASTVTDGDHPAVAAAAAFRAAGGIVKGVWGVQKGIYFQNAIQIGDLWCDLANDTVDPQRPAVELCPLAEARFEELPSFELFARVAAEYWGQAAYPNHVFPDLAAVLPVLLVSPEGGIRLASPKTLLPRNMRLDYTLSARFLGSGECASRRLPDAVLDRLQLACHRQSGWFASVPSWCRRFDPTLGPAGVDRLIAAERGACRNLGEADFMRRFIDMIRCTTLPVGA